jgi:hypothetical protein
MRKKQTPRIAALNRMRFSVPTRWTRRAVRPEPVIPPSIASADETEDTFRLSRVVDLVRQRPELADEENSEEEPAEEKERRRDPDLSGLEQEPERHQKADDRHLGAGEHPELGHSPYRPAVVIHDEAHREPGEEKHVGDVVGAEVVDELGGRRGLDVVIRGHHQEGVDEHQDAGDRFALSEGHEGRQHASEEGIDHATRRMLCQARGAANG